LKAIAAFLLLVSSASAEMIVIKTDSLPLESSKRIGALPVGVRLLTVLTAPADGELVSVQILWGSLNGTAAPVQQSAIRVSAFASNRIPVTTLATVSNPVLVDHGDNIFDLPQPVSVSAGTHFFVDLQFLTATTTGPNAPTVLMDGDGIQGQDAIFIPSANSWAAPFTIAIGGGGDMGIRAIMRTVPEPSTLILAFLGLMLCSPHPCFYSRSWRFGKNDSI
jgi:hypothetical protein